jgi:hypothetical protein
VEKKPTQHGLVGMRFRIESHGGTLVVTAMQRGARKSWRAAGQSGLETGPQRRHRTRWVITSQPVTLRC